MAVVFVLLGGRLTLWSLVDSQPDAVKPAQERGSAETEMGTPGAPQQAESVAAHAASEVAHVDAIFSRAQEPLADRLGSAYGPLVGPGRVGAATGKAPWPRRMRSGVLVADSFEPAFPGALNAVRLKALGLRGSSRSYINSQRWPDEPRAPTTVDPVRFRAAVASLCPTDTPSPRVTVLAESALAAASAFSVEPFLLVSLAYQQSRCDTVDPDSWGIGITRVNLGMHRNRIKNGRYRYRVWRGEKDGFSAEQLAMPRFNFDRAQLSRVAPNLYFAAAFLRVFSEQCPDIDRAFGSAPHRSPVSHVIWGDEVRSSLPEDLVLTARRRLLGYYTPPLRRRSAYYRGIALGSPLDGEPRVVIGVMGDPRESGRRRHAGIDLLSVHDEPVRAMASGTVVFAGVDSRRRGLLSLLPEQAEHAQPGAMGPRGLFVQVVHGSEVSTLYVHLSRYVVKTGDMVQRGQVLGYVGRTGIHTSDAHLHLGLFDHGVPVDPLPHLRPLLITADDMTLSPIEPPLEPSLENDAASRRRRRQSRLSTPRTNPVGAGSVGAHLPSAREVPSAPPRGPAP